VSSGEAEEGADGGGAPDYLASEYVGSSGPDDLHDSNGGNGGSSRSSASAGSATSSTGSVGSSSSPRLGLGVRGAAAASGGRGGGLTAQHETELASSSSLSSTEILTKQGAPWVRLPGSPPVEGGPDATEALT